MPYIIKEERVQLDTKIEDLSDVILTPGELAYALFRLTNGYIQREKPAYTVLAGVIGVLETAKLELMRRVVEPYEDGKRQANGDVL